MKIYIFKTDNTILFLPFHSSIYQLKPNQTVSFDQEDVRL